MLTVAALKPQTEKFTRHQSGMEAMQYETNETLELLI